MDSFPQNPRERIFDLLRGKTVVVPDLQKRLEHWPRGMHPELPRLEKDVDERLELLFPPVRDSKRLKRMRAAKIALFGASWWPYASWDALRIATYLSIWLFAWDDETDSTEFSDLVNDFDAATNFRDETMKVIYESLDMTSEGSGGSSASSQSSGPSENPIITSFKPVGHAISNSGSPDQVTRFYKELDFFVRMTALEQQVQISGTLPTVEEYLSRRMGSSAVRVCFAITEYASDMEIPPSIMQSKDMAVLWEECNMIISVTNDVLSIKKELAQDQVDTLIPLLTLRLGSAQAAMDHTGRLVSASVEKFDAAAGRLLERHRHDAQLRTNLVTFIDGCKYACTANLNWSLESGRYKLDCCSTQGGVRVVL